MHEFLRKIRLLLEMIRFSHTIFALPFAMMAAAMAWKMPWSDVANEPRSWGLPLLGVLICMVGARSAAMAFNRIVDRRIDAANPRTAGRHLPRGDIRLGTAVAFTIGSGFVFLCGTLLFWPNWLPLAAAGPVLVVLLGYSLAKRFTVFVHYWLGFALLLAPLCTWVALRGAEVLQNPAEMAPVAVLSWGVFFWVGGFDIIYACQDEAADRAAGLRSIPAWLGTQAALRWAAISHALAFVCFGAVGWVAPEALGLGWLYAGTVLLIGGLLAYQHFLVSPTDLSRVNIAFFNVNATISIGLLVAMLVDLWWL